jgi:hypothetical protein
LRQKTSILLATIALFSLVAFGERDSIASMLKSQSSSKQDSKGGAGVESPFACNVGGISAERRPRYVALAKKLISSKQEVRELADGYEFRLPADETTIKEVAEFISYERQCCPFFDLELAIEREGGPLWLRFKGREGVKEFIRIEFGIK